MPKPHFIEIMQTFIKTRGSIIFGLQLETKSYRGTAELSLKNFVVGFQTNFDNRSKNKHKSGRVGLHINLEFLIQWESDKSPNSQYRILSSDDKSGSNGRKSEGP